VTLVELREQPGDSSGAAQAARCLDYTAQGHPHVEPIRPYDVVGIELRAEWVDMNASSGEHGGGPLAPSQGLLRGLRDLSRR
jgi:hypothetical protein